MAPAAPSPRGRPPLGHAHDVISPVTGEAIDRVALTTAAEIVRSLAVDSPIEAAAERGPVLAFLGRLHDQLVARQAQLVDITILETGFIRDDSRDIIAGAIEFLRDFGEYARSQESRPVLVPHSFASPSAREMRLTHRPYRWVAAMVPQNASLTLGLTIIASALTAGSRVLLRPSLQCGVSGVILAEMVRSCEPPAPVEIVNCLASDFLRASQESEHVDLIHYIGSNHHAPRVLADSLAAHKLCLLDGQGNGLLYVDASFPIDDAIRIITSGATRFNGETCTSVNGVLVEAAVYPQVRDGLAAAFRDLAVGDPRAARMQVGPLFSEDHAAGLVRDLRARASHRVLTGGVARGAYFVPAVVEGVEIGDTLAREGCFGPALWVAPIHERAVFEWIRANRFPLSDTVLSTRPEVVEAFAMNSRAARICVNEDPSVESMFEPWGGYPPSGLNPVSNWIDKYRQLYQLDGQHAVLDRSVRALRSEGA